jgi:hypothetical protein
MKRKKSLSTVDFSPLTKNEALSTKGGGKWVKTDDGWTYMLDEVTVPGYPNDGSFHVGDEDHCRKCDLMNPDRFSQVSQDDVRDGLPGYTLGVSVYHYVTRKR